MASAAFSEPAVPPSPARGGPDQFFWRRLHSITGLLPLGAFLLEHFISNDAVLSADPARSYGDQVKFLNSVPFVLILEIALIYAPLLFHALYGVWITKQSEPNTLRYSWWGNWAYLWQRISGIVLLAFIAWHVWTARFSGLSIPDNPYAAYDKMAAQMANPWIFAWFLIGITMVCYHFAYGLYLFAAKWGITLGPVARRRWGWICLLLGIALTYAGAASAFKFRGIDLYPLR